MMNLSVAWHHSWVSSGVAGTGMEDLRTANHTLCECCSRSGDSTFALATVTKAAKEFFQGCSKDEEETVSGKAGRISSAGDHRRVVKVHGTRLTARTCNHPAMSHLGKCPGESLMQVSGSLCVEDVLVCHLNTVYPLSDSVVRKLGWIHGLYAFFDAFRLSGTAVRMWYNSEISSSFIRVKSRGTLRNERS